MAGSELHNFLMFDFNHVLCRDFDIETDRANIVCITLASVGRDIQETLLECYLSNISVDKRVMDDHIAAYYGMEVMNVICDCHGHGCYEWSLKRSEWYDAGVNFRKKKTPEYRWIKKVVKNFHIDLHP